MKASQHGSGWAHFIRPTCMWPCACSHQGPVNSPDSFNICVVSCLPIVWWPHCVPGTSSEPRTQRWGDRVPALEGYRKRLDGWRSCTFPWVAKEMCKLLLSAPSLAFYYSHFQVYFPSESHHQSELSMWGHSSPHLRAWCLYQPYL